MNRPNRLVYVDVRSPSAVTIAGEHAEGIARAVAGAEARKSFSGGRWIVPPRFLSDVFAAIDNAHLVAAVSRPKTGRR